MNKKVFMDKSIDTIFSKMGYEYEDMNALMRDSAMHRLEGVSAAEADAKIRELMFNLLELTPETVENKKMYRRAMARNKDKFFEVIEDTVEDCLIQGWNEDPFFMDYVDVNNMAVGDRNEFYVEDEVLLTVSKVAGDHHDFSLQRLGEGSTFSVKTATYGAAVGADIKLYLAGRIDFSKMIEAVYKAFDKKIKALLYSELTNVGSKLPVNSMFNKAMALSSTTKPTFDQLLEDVSTANGNSEVMIVGSSVAIKKLEALDDVNWRSEAAKEERFRTGRIGTFEGHPVVEIPQQFAKKGATLERLVKDDQLLIIPTGMDKPIKMVYEGDASIVEVMDIAERMDDTMKFEYQMSFGVSTIVGKYFGNVKITG